jgi:hypothetical protein
MLEERKKKGSGLFQMPWKMRSKPETVLLFKVEERLIFFVIVDILNRGYGLYIANMSIWDEWQEH